MSEINVGDVMDLFTDPPFTDADGAPADPDLVQCLVRRAGYAPVTYEFGVDAEVTKTATGTYHCRFEITEGGKYYYRWQGSPDPQAAEENTFTVSAVF